MLRIGDLELGLLGGDERIVNGPALSMRVADLDLVERAIKTADGLRLLRAPRVRMKSGQSIRHLPE